VARAVDSLAKRVIASRVTPGLGVAVVMDGQTILAKGYGWADAGAKIPADERTLWYVASTSKSFTGFGVALLVSQHVIGLSRPITTLLPGVQWPDGVDASRLTLAHFLSHTHHINDDAVVQSAAYTGAFPEAEWPALIRFARPSGNDDLVYSNFGYNVAAMVIDRLQAGLRLFEERFGPPMALVAGGGVVANQTIRGLLQTVATEADTVLMLPPAELCTDNAAMIAWAGAERLAHGLIDTLESGPHPRWPLDQVRKADTFSASRA